MSPLKGLAHGLYPAKSLSSAALHSRNGQEGQDLGLYFISVIIFGFHIFITKVVFIEYSKTFANIRRMTKIIKYIFYLVFVI